MSKQEWKLDESEIDLVWQSMPGGPEHWLKGFGYQNFARAIECEVLAKVLPKDEGAPAGSFADRLYARVQEMQGAAHTFGETCQSSVEIALDGVIDAIDEIAKESVAPSAASIEGLTPEQAVLQKTFAERLYGSGPDIDQRRDALYTMALIFAAAETDSAREATFEDMFKEFCAVPRLAIFDSLTRHTGAEIATNYTFETEEFFEVEAVERLLATQSAKQGAQPEPKAENLPSQVDDMLLCAINCAHAIDDEKIVLRRDPSKPGNALNQLHQRLDVALLAQFELAGRTPAQATPEQAAQVQADVRSAAQAVLDDALDEARSRAHPCDQNNDDAVARLLPPVMQSLYGAMKSKRAASTDGDQGAEN